MRSFWISLILFGVMLAVLIGSMVIVNRVCDRMMDFLAELPLEPGELTVEKVKDFREYWMQRRGWVHPAVNHTELNAVSDLLCSLEVFSDPEEEEAAEYRNMIALLGNAIEELRRLERFSFANIV